MKLNRVLVVIKPDTGESVPCRGPRRGTAQAASAQHADALIRVVTSLTAMGLSHRVVPRDRLPRRLRADLVVPVGGDGTFLAAAHAAGDIPLVGVNSMPERSIGFFCAATPDTFKQVLSRILAGAIAPQPLPLLTTRIDGRPLPVHALNDILFAGVSPAETVRYELRIVERARPPREPRRNADTLARRGGREEQRSSGVWIASGPGSTAAIHSAGGSPLSLMSKRLQFFVREPCPLPARRYRLTRGVLGAGSEVVITCLMKHGMVYVDGHWHAFAVPPYATVSCELSTRTLKVFLEKT